MKNVIDLKSHLGVPMFFAADKIVCVFPKVDRPGYVFIYTSDGSGWECLGDLAMIVSFMEKAKP